MKTYKQFIFESEEARKDLYELAPLAAAGAALGLLGTGLGAYDTYRSAKRFAKQPSLRGALDVGIDATGMIPYAGMLSKGLRGWKYWNKAQQLGAAGEAAGLTRDAPAYARYFNKLGQDIKTHGIAPRRRFNDVLNKDGDGLLDTEKYQAADDKARIEKAKKDQEERTRKQDDTPSIEPTVTILQQPQKDGTVKRTDVTDTNPPSSFRQPSTQQPSTSQQQTPAPQQPERKKRNGSNMTNWDQFVPPGMVMPGGRK